MILQDRKHERIIKRYANRKLYDTSKSVYVTLTELGELIRCGEHLKVIDKNSGRDITINTMIQILFENEKKLELKAPRELFRQMIQTGEGGITCFLVDRGIIAKSDLCGESAGMVKVLDSISPLIAREAAIAAVELNRQKLTEILKSLTDTTAVEPLLPVSHVNLQQEIQAGSKGVTEMRTMS